jgi:tRNA threonylcarbamoyladenosine biosynthesis protein TsaE
MQEIICRSEEETKEFGKKLAGILKQGDIVILTGELGAGKTKLVEGILTYYGLKDEISSPTFTIVNEYRTDKVRINHFDLYRLKNTMEFENIGGEEYFPKGINLIEWGDMIENILPRDYMKITILKGDNYDTDRKLEVEEFGTRFNDVDFSKL